MSRIDRSRWPGFVLAAFALAAMAWPAAGVAASAAPDAGAATPTPRAAPKAAAPAAAPGKPATDDNFVESVTVNVVNVDVYVNDKKGRVTGLAKSDFEVYEDGRPMAITNFLAVEGGKATGAAAVEESAADAANHRPKLPAGYEQAPIPEDQKLRLIVYIDNFNLKPFDRNRVMRDLRIFLDQKLRRGDQVMLVTYDRELHVRQPFTSDTGLVNAQLLALEKISAQGVHGESDRREVLKNIEDAQSGSQAMEFARGYAGAAFNDISFTVDALKNLVTSLAGMSGRKAVVYVSDGLPMVVGEDVFYAVQNKYPGTSIISESSEFDTSRRFDELTSQANANRVTFYTIDAGGLRVYSSTSAENATAGQGVYIDSINISNVQASLQMMAEKTGGTYVINANNVAPQLDKIAEDFNTFYSLGYTPPHVGDGRFHKITVKVRRKGVTVRCREGYRDKSIEARMSDGTLAALQFPFQTNPIGLSLEFGHPAARSDGLFLVPISVKIPLGKLTLVPREQGSAAKVRLFIGAIDPDGHTSEVQQVPVPISVPAGEVSKLAGKHFLYTLSLLMRGGDQKVAIGIRDDVGAQESYVTGELVVGR
ncbi:MAG TPA: VWA domain-containing protein [Thermoanaerobaculia bacterium]|nr:VWA domain-containing protein [Thermoanaerobaculia bacterium]